MRQKILDLKELYDFEINKELFFKLLLHVTDGHKEPTSHYANYLDIENWEKLFSIEHKKITVINPQLLIFFEYMIKYHSNYFGKNQEQYFVHKEFMNNGLRTEENFQLESVLLTAFEIL